MQRNSHFLYCLLLLLSVISLFFTGCAAVINMEVLKPAELDLHDVRSVGILDFEYPRSNLTITTEMHNRLRDLTVKVTGKTEIRNSRISDYLTNSMVSVLVNTGIYSVKRPGAAAGEIRSIDDMDPRELGRMMDVEVLLFGEIIDVDTVMESYMATQYQFDPVLKVMEEIQVPMVQKSVDLSFSYTLMSARNGEIIAVETLDEQSITKIEERSVQYIKSTEQMAREVIDMLMEKVSRHIAPYYVQESRYLRAGSMQDERFQEALRYIRSGFYSRGMEIFIYLWEDKGDPDAGFNAALVMEALGEYSEAVDLMAEVAEASGDRSAMAEFNRMKKTLLDRYKAESQLQ